MKHAASVPQARKSRRRWRVPPVLLHGSEALEGGDVLQELPCDTGLLLWQALRDVTLWACTPPPERKNLFSAEAERRRVADILSVGPEPALEAALGAITTLVGRPDRVWGEQVALACRQISHWAEERGALGTALAFVQAAALACPGDPSASFKVGQIARKRAENARAESWFRRTISLARQAGDWTSYSLAFLGLGTLYMQRGNFPGARRFYVRCLRAAKRHGLREIQGGACHDLFAISIQSERTAEAQEYARAAFQAYGPSSQRLPRLAHDVAYFWMTQGDFARAVPVLRALLPHTRTPAERLIAASNLTRGAGAVGDRELFLQAWEEAQQIIQEGTAMEECAHAWLEMAHGAASICDWERASIAASCALDLARARGEARIEIAAEAVADCVRCQRSMVPELGETGVHNAEAEALAQDFVDSLTAYAVPG